MKYARGLAAFFAFISSVDIAPKPAPRALNVFNHIPRACGASISLRLAYVTKR